ncbi:MAG: RsmD family RNA methyltransferase [Verrucomicrobiota bacterium]|nr:MAG: RsmD family RNA methyltransferase [Verrucomicrobiota bacterium]
MRITGGIARGIRLKTIDEDTLRPATDYLRQAVFSSLGERVIGQRFLDLFSGVGGYGLEAWSRGAQSGIFIENNTKIARVLEDNITTIQRQLETNVNCPVWYSDAMTANVGETFGLIFVDPPYALARAYGSAMLTRFAQYLTPTSQSRLVFEMPVDIELPPPPGLKAVRRFAKRGKNSPAAVIYAPDS